MGTGTTHQSQLSQITPSSGPRDDRSKHHAYWAVGLNNLLDEGWRLCGTGRKGEAAAGIFSEDRKGNTPSVYGAFGGKTCSVAGGGEASLTEQTGGICTGP